MNFLHFPSFSTESQISLPFCEWYTYILRYTRHSDFFSPREHNRLFGFESPTCQTKQIVKWRLAHQTFFSLETKVGLPLETKDYLLFPKTTHTGLMLY